MEGEWKEVEHLLVGLLIVIGHSVEQSFFVPQDVVVYQVILHLCLTDLWSFYDLLVFENF